ncbi:deoxyribodipyrimidine photo-lyase [Leptolyngbya sp. FACHB-36]|uniref:cryptochrome/photolyase family protein n=1 Tax=Leptolyngbya sp. FACHB-36 TaxID=2692808 RepID=UPI00168080E2|nr:deoxyribodipyrimidine photo-lyase [Leptolyngbya sp. FACHB-36]MBD2020829.1 deoxyribodipyrimidine photo-lyase [Leptolyngbya sp. FACHB-36]
MNRTIVWFRRDLRIADHAPLYRAAQRGAVIPVFILDRALLHHPETASARVAFMLECLRSLDADLRERGGRLILRSGNPVDVLPQLIRETQAEGVYAYTDFERIYGRVRDARLNRALAQQQLKIRWFEPLGTVADLVTAQQYREVWYGDMKAAIVPTPSRIQVPPEVSSDPIPSLAAVGHLNDGKPLPPASTKAARQLLQQFIEQKTTRYYWQLSYPSAEATSGLSPHIKFGVISLRECYQTVQLLKNMPDERIQRSRKQFISRLRWNSGFAQRFRYLPQLEVRSLYQEFEEADEAFDETLYQAWQQGHTGFPIIDAAARCLLATGGWQALNFRTRACYASFLSNLLGIDWRYGALHFMRHLIDGDCPIDHYQWAMQAGITSAIDLSWTRIYNPGQVAVKRFDPEGQFIQQWVPELRHLPTEHLGLPLLVKDYPLPIVNYQQARARRIQQLEQRRQVFMKQGNIVPYLTRLPQSVVPFGADRYESEVGWATLPDCDLFPAGLDLDALDLEQATALRTWFMAPVGVNPRSTSQRRSQVAVQEAQLTLL